jgi:hypothetical protein
MPPPPLVPKGGGGGHTRFRERWWGSPNSDEVTDIVVHYAYIRYVLCATKGDASLFGSTDTCALMDSVEPFILETDGLFQGHFCKKKKIQAQKSPLISLAGFTLRNKKYSTGTTKNINFATEIAETFKSSLTKLRRGKERKDTYPDWSRFSRLPD